MVETAVLYNTRVNATIGPEENGGLSLAREPERTADHPWLNYAFVSNALPEPGRGGGLVLLGEPALVRNTDGKTPATWFGYSSVQGARELNKPYESFGIALPEQVYELYYKGTANSVLWPLLHGMPEFYRPELVDPNALQAFFEVQKEFAQTVFENTPPGTMVAWQDYHLLGAKQEFDNIARERGSMRVYDPHSFFLHIPFPDVSILEHSMPPSLRSYLLRGLLAYDLAGFQTSGRDVAHFLEAVTRFFPEAQIGKQDANGHHRVRLHSHETRVGAFPASIDPQKYRDIASSKEVDAYVEQLKAKYYNRRIIFNLGRNDYTKGFYEELIAYDRILEEHPELLSPDDPTVSHPPLLIQAISPSRLGVPLEDQYHHAVVRKAEEIRAKWKARGFGDVIQQEFRFIPEAEKHAYLRIANVLSTPAVADGNNLAVKEGIVVNSVTTLTTARRQKAAIVLGLGAGAAEEFGSKALLTNPRDTRQLAHTLYRALTMSSRERAARLGALTNVIENHTASDWAQQQEAIMAEIYRERFHIAP